MSDMRVAAIITANSSNFIQGFSQAERRVQGFGKRIEHVGSRISSFGNTITGGLTSLVSALGAAALVKGVYDMDKRLYRVANNADLTKKEMFALKQQLFELGPATHQGPEQLLSAVEKILQKTGDFKFALASLKDMGTISSATGSDMESIGAVAADLKEKFRILPDAILPVFDILATQGKAGSFELKDMSTYLSRVLSSASAMGVSGVRGVRTIGALLQFGNRATDDAAMTSTAIERLFSNLSTNWKAASEITNGFSVFDPVKSKQEGRHVLKELDVVLKELIIRTKGDMVKLQKVFKEESIKPIKALVQSYIDNGGFEEFDALAAKGGDGAEIMKQYAFWSESTAAKLADLNTQIKKFADTNLAGPIDGLNQALEALNANPVWTNKGLKVILGILGIGFGSKIAGKVISAGGKAITWLGGAAAAGETALAGATMYSGYMAGGPINRGMGWMSGKLTGGRYSGPGYLGEAIYDLTHGGIQNIINLELNLETGRIQKKSDDMNTHLNVLNTGRLLPEASGR